MKFFAAILLAGGILCQVLPAQERSSAASISPASPFGTTTSSEPSSTVLKRSTPEGTVDLTALFRGKMDRPSPVIPPMADSLEKKVREAEKKKKEEALFVSAKMNSRAPAAPIPADPAVETPLKRVAAVEPAPRHRPAAPTEPPATMESRSPESVGNGHASARTSSEAASETPSSEEPANRPFRGLFQGGNRPAKADPPREKKSKPLFGGGGLKKLFSRKKQVVPAK